VSNSTHYPSAVKMVVDLFEIFLKALFWKSPRFSTIGKETAQTLDMHPQAINMMATI
jgi:hypothetical protein